MENHYPKTGTLEQQTQLDKQGVQAFKFEYPSPQVTSEKKRQSIFDSVTRHLPILGFDLVSLTLVLLLTYEINSERLLKGLFSTSHYLSINIDRVIFYASVVFLVLLVFGISNLYKHDVMVSRAKQLFLITRSFLISTITVIVISFLFMNSTISESFKDFLIWFTVFGIMITFAGRLIFRYIIRTNQKFSTLKPARNIIVIGAGQAAKLYTANLKNVNGVDHVVFLDDDESKLGTSILGYPVVGKPEDVVFKAITMKAEEVCIIINNIEKERLLEIIQYCKRTGLPTKVLSSHYNLMFTGMYDECHGMMNTIPLHHQIDNKIDNLCKRFLDIAGASVACLLILIPGLVLALLIKLTSSGPVFHQSFRVGKRGKLFKMIKFRSMRVNSEQKHQQAALERLKNGLHMGKVTDDPRITPIGRVLRKYSLDELPQFLNVLRGDMSLVGPRPCFEYEMDMFEEWHHRRFLMKPGITGLWQVTGRQMNDLMLNDAMTTDVFYTDNYSIWMDIRIMFKTIPVVVLGKGR